MLTAALTSSARPFRPNGNLFRSAVQSYCKKNKNRLNGEVGRDKLSDSKGKLHGMRIEGKLS